MYSAYIKHYYKHFKVSCILLIVLSAVNASNCLMAGTVYNSLLFSSYGVLLSSSLVCKDLEADIYSIYSIRCLSIIVPIYHLVRRVMFCWHMSEPILLCFPFFNINKYCFGYCKFIYIKTHYILKGSCEQSELIDININDVLYANNHLLWQKNKPVISKE